MRIRASAPLVVLVVVALCGGAGTALANKSASRSQANAVAQAIRSSPVAQINRVPTNRYRVTRVRISTVSSAWAMASLVPTKAFRNTFQSAIVVAVKPAGPRSRWVVVDLGSAQVGCGIAPNVVLADLLGLKSGESPCGPGEGIS
jgi:hypothetical protein